MADLFKQKKTELPAPREISTPEQKAARGVLSGYSQYGAQARAPEAYPGQLTAPLEPYEQKVPGILESYMGRTTPEMWRMGGEEVRKTMLGEYDPATSPYYGALKRGVLKESEEAGTRLRQGAQIGGMLRSRGRMGQERELQEETHGKLSDIMAGLSETERARRLETVPLALGMGQYEEAAPLRTMEAIQQFTQRPIKQADLERMYGEYQRQIGEEKYPLQMAQQLAQPGMYEYYQPEYMTEESPFEKYGMPLIQGGMSAAAMAAAPATGGMSLAALMAAQKKRKAGSYDLSSLYA